MSDGDPSLAERMGSSLRLGARTVGAVSRAGLLGPVRPDRLARMAIAPLRHGAGLATLVAVAAARHPDQPAIVDDRGAVTYGELDRRTAAIAAALRSDFGVGSGRALALMCRNHRGFVEAAAAASRCGVDLLLVNTELPAPQLAQILDRARPAAVVHDPEFAARYDEAAFTGRRIVGWDDGGVPETTLDELAARPVRRAPASWRQGKLVLLTSGTTGTPKSAPRDPTGRGMVAPAATLLAEVPFRAREPMLIGPPLFHGFGFAFLALGLFLGSTMVVRRSFDADTALADIEEHGVTTVMAVPVMLQRILDRHRGATRPRETGSLRTVLSAAAPLNGTLSEAFMDVFGDLLYNAYGTTETGFGAIATPADLRAAPGTAGRPPAGTTVKILDEERREAQRGRTGHVFMGGDMVFEGYSNGATKETVRGLMNTGDLGHLDAEGRLFIDGREDDMIVSGGENVFPAEVEDVLRRHESVADVAVLGVEDAEFGQRLRAFVVCRDGTEASETELEDHVRANLERYKVPRDFLFMDELPRNATGKVLHKLLRRAPAPSP